MIYHLMFSCRFKRVLRMNTERQVLNLCFLDQKEGLVGRIRQHITLEPYLRLSNSFDRFAL